MGVGRHLSYPGWVAEYILALWDARVRRLHVSPQSGFPMIRTQDLKVFWFTLLIPSALVAQMVPGGQPQGLNKQMAS